MSVEVHREIVYESRPGFRPLELDLYVGDEPRAVCVWLHGGGFLRGSRRNGPGPADAGTRQLARAAERGLVMASVEYRLSGEAKFPAPLDDVVAACRFLRSTGNEVDVTGLPLVLWGTSAGGQLAGLCALSSSVGDDVVAVASWSAPVDVLELPNDVDAIGEQGDGGPDSREGQLLGAVPADVPELARAASPLHQVRSTTTAFLLVHGTADRNIPVAQTDRYVTALTAAGVPVGQVRVDGADHFYGSISDAELDRVVDTTVDFLLAATTKGSS